MAFEFKCKTREGDGEIIIRGTNDGQVEFCREVNVLDPETKKPTGEVSLQPFKFFAAIEHAIDKLFRMRVCNRDANSLEELLSNVKEERELLHNEFEGIFPQSQRKRRNL